MAKRIASLDRALMALRRTHGEGAHKTLDASSSADARRVENRLAYGMIANRMVQAAYRDRAA